MQAFMNMLSPGYFDAMGIPLLDGRDFGRGDEERCRSGDRQPAVRRALLPRQSASAGTSASATGPKSKMDIEIVGVVGTRSTKARAKASAARSSSRTGATTGDLLPRTQDASRAVDRADPRRGEDTRRRHAGLPHEDARRPARRDAADRPPDRDAVGRFRVLATVLASVGLYGVMAFVVAAGARRWASAGARRGARPGDLAGDEGSAYAAGHRVGGRPARRHRPGPLRLLTALRRATERPVGGAGDAAVLLVSAVAGLIRPGARAASTRSWPCDMNKRGQSPAESPGTVPVQLRTVPVHSWLEACRPR